jgi:hypothetical protein
MPENTAKLKLSIEDYEGEPHILVAVVRSVAIGRLRDRFQHHGFGTFMCDIQPHEVEVTAEARAALLDTPYRRGLQGLEFWEDNRIAWGSRDPSLLVPLGDVNVPSGAKDWISKLNGTVAE